MDGHLIIGEFILTLGAFLALLFVIHKFAWTPFNQMLEERQNKVQADWQAAEDAKKDAEDHHATIKEQLKQAHLQADQIIRKAHKESENMREEMLAETKAQQARLVEMTQADLEARRQHFEYQMKESVGLMAVTMAEKILKREITPEDHQRVNQSFIARLEELDEQ